MRLHFSLAILPLLLALGCTPLPPQDTSPKPPPGTFKALSLNTWHEGTQVPNGYESLVAEILASQADVIALSEIRNRDGVDFLRRCVAALNQAGQGTYYGISCEGDTAVLSRWPIQSITRIPGGDGVRAMVQMGAQSLAVYSVHLDYTHYACSLPRGYCDGSAAYPGWNLRDDGTGQPSPITDIAIIGRNNRASARQTAIRACLDDAGKLPADIPIVLMGDFNEPSHLDWIDGNKHRYDRHGVVYPWDTTRLLADHGFQDAYRVLQPSPLTHPGFTWPAVAGAGQQCSWLKLADERDRIDYVFFRGALAPKEAVVWGPEASSVRGATELEQTQDRFAMGTRHWPSDHKGVRVTFAFTAH